MKISFNWLKQYLADNYQIDLKQSPEKVAQILSLHSFETKVVDQGKCLDIEVTPERGDALSIAGIAREWATIAGIKN